MQVDPIHEPFRSGHESDPDSGADDLREAVEANDATLGVQLKETRSFLRNKLHKTKLKIFFFVTQISSKYRKIIIFFMFIQNNLKIIVSIVLKDDYVVFASDLVYFVPPKN
jgi:hypothetical protein